MENPIIAEVRRGPIVESRHRGSYVVRNLKGETHLSGGDITSPVYPRSAMKIFQCLPMVQAGAADRYGLNEEEIALCCSSHGGEPDHVRVARSILHKCGAAEDCYECGTHAPASTPAAYQLVRDGEKPGQVHNVCSGKHAGMIAFAKHLGVDPKGYTTPEHPVQKAIAATIAQWCEVDVAKAPMGIDGCSVPTWALPLTQTALGFAKLSNPEVAAAARIIKAVSHHPFMVAGTGRFDTRVMQAVPRLFMKFGAEGVYCGTIAHAGLGFAMKCDDGAARAV
ncbi:MAG: asparaginase, partial [Alphaproteobacteria bacterium]|nr:asparaginase [Alphaproteobacteria bacterium]